MNQFNLDFQIIAIAQLLQITAFYMLNSIYLEKLKDKNKYTSFNVDFLGYLSHLKHILKIIPENICSKNNEKTQV